MVLNDVLCFLSTSRDSMTSDELILVATAFYKPEDILKAKELIFNLCKEKITTRKTCQSHPNPILADTQDIINLITKKDNGSSTLPKFVTGGCYSLPPTTGCIAFARAFNRLRDELSEVKTEMRELRSTKDKEAKAIEDSNDVRQDISDIKTMLIKEIVPTNAHENPETQSREQERDRPSSTSYRDSLNRKPGPFVGKRNAISGTVRNAPNVSETYSAIALRDLSKIVQNLKPFSGVERNQTKAKVILRLSVPLADWIFMWEERT